MIKSLDVTPDVLSYVYERISMIPEENDEF
jgi:hypothetical protein